MSNDWWELITANLKCSRTHANNPSTGSSVNFTRNAGMETKQRWVGERELWNKVALEFSWGEKPWILLMQLLVRIVPLNFKYTLDHSEVSFTGKLHRYFNLDAVLSSSLELSRYESETHVHRCNGWWELTAANSKCSQTHVKNASTGKFLLLDSPKPRPLIRFRNFLVRLPWYLRREFGIPLWN